jgi:hypothetical protein
MSNIASCLRGVVIETLYIEKQSDLALLPVAYQNAHPCPTQIGQHGCDRALFEIELNGVFVGESRLNNGGSVGTATTPRGTLVCKDFENTPGPLTSSGTWTGDSGSRYSRIVITNSKANEIQAASTGNTISVQLKGAIDTYFGSNLTVCGSSGSHADVTWVRITSATGVVLYNSCLNQSLTNLYICPLCIEMDVIVKKDPLKKEKCFGIAPILGIFNNKNYYRVNSCGQSAAGFLIWRNGGSGFRWEFHQFFNATTGVVSGDFYGYNTASLPWNGTWVIPSPTTTERQIISIKEDASTCLTITTTESCPCAGLITSKK